MKKGFISVGLVILLLLVVAGVGYLVFQQKNNQNNLTEETPPAETELTCGIFVEKPAAGDQLVVGTTFQVKGYVNGCGWTAFEGEVAAVSVEDINGNDVMNGKPVPALGEWMQLPAYFDTTFTLDLPATAGSGFVIFGNQDASGENPQIFKVPVIFGTD